ncbi:DNA-directed RNA polymerase subunit beta'' [Bienertia sinuspersici]
MFLFAWRIDWIVLGGTNGACFRRSDMLPSYVIWNNKSISQYSKFYIQSKFSRSCSCFSKSSSLWPYRLVKSIKRKRCYRGMIPIGTELIEFMHYSSLHKCIPLYDEAEVNFGDGTQKSKPIMSHYISENVSKKLEKADLVAWLAISLAVIMLIKCCLGGLENGTKSRETHSPSKRDAAVLLGSPAPDVRSPQTIPTSD